MGYVQTVRGPVAPESLGRVMPHEHLGSLVPGPWLSGGAGDHRADLAVDAVAGLPGLGFGTVVDLSPYEVVGHDVTLLRDVAERTGLNVVAGSSIYLEPYSPRWALEAGVDEMRERFVADATVGIGDTGIKAGIYGEQATGLNEITPHEEKCLRAAARAHRVTGLSINTHTTHGTMALEQVEILREEKVDLDRVVIGHMDIHPDPAYLRAVLKTGVSIAFDTIGKQFWDFVLAPPPEDPPEGEFGKRAYYRPDRSRLSNLAALVREGYADRILLAQDMTGAEAYLNPRTHGRLGYSYLGQEIVPALGRLGVSDDDLEQMLVRNPARLLTIG
ncbi:phosphotriesterase family protein [Planosporangium mesophilum]|uniref:Phosphotriesterase n=1 Tax=Planosporangium mesophilum TaxID=689768 RepID=A0A8J3X2N4_9ACTN|nr:aryldialkylphosphatase [Planosporangium mesophilum]NJC84352.1 aryldialkylphosphatase [Planosporangium mesophilum]GII25625.1 phosphotriesterase [Planosporangium mesophilum]